MAAAVGHNIQHIELNTFNKSRFRPNMKTNEVDNSVYFYNTDVPDFGKFLLSETFADVHLISGEKKISAHRSRLSAVSPFLAALFAKDTSDVSVIIIPDVKYETLRILIHFIYTGFIRATECEVYDLLEAGRLLGVDKSIDVDPVDFRRNQAEAPRSKQKRRVPAGGSNSRTKKKRTTGSSPQTVVIFDTFESNTMQLPSVLGQPVSDPLDVSDICSSDVILLHDDSNAETTEQIEAMEVCPSPVPTPQDSQQIETATENSEAIADVTIEDVRSIDESTTPNKVPIIVESINRTENKETSETCNGNISQAAADGSLTPSVLHNENMDKQQLDQNTCQGEFQSFLKNNTQPKESPEKGQVAKTQVVPMANLTPTIENVTSLSASISPSLILNSSPDNEKDSSSSNTPKVTDILEPEEETQCLKPSELTPGNNVNIELTSGELHTSPPNVLSTHRAEITIAKDSITTESTDMVQQQEEIQVPTMFSMSEPSTSNTIEQLEQKETTTLVMPLFQLPINPTDKDVTPEAHKVEAKATSSATPDTASPRTGLSKTVQQALAGLKMWKNFKQKQSKSDNQSVPVSPQRPSNPVQQTITILSPKSNTNTISEVDKEIIEKELCSQIDPLQIESLSEDTSRPEIPRDFSSTE